MKDANDRSLMYKRIIDFVSVIFLSYPFAAIVWAHYTLPFGMATSVKPHLALPILLIVLDILPCAFALVWLFSRYQQILRVVRDKRFVPVFVLIVLTLFILGETYWR